MTRGPLRHKWLVMQSVGTAFMICMVLASPSSASPPASGDYDSIVLAALELERAGKVEEALERYKQAMRADPEKSEPLARASMLYLILKKPNMALATADSAIKIDPGHRGAWLNKSVIELSSGLTKEALLTTKLALRRFPEDTGLMNNMATAQIKLGKLNRAKNTLLKAIKLKPNDSSLNYNLACTYALSDINMTALIYLEKAIALDPSLKDSAKKDPDLKGLREMEPFKALTSD